MALIEPQKEKRKKKRELHNMKYLKLGITRMVVVVVVVIIG